MNLSPVILAAINVVKGSNLARIDVAGVLPGIYLVQVSNRDLQLTQKVMIVR